MLSGLIRPVRIALSAALKLFPTASDTTFTAQFYRQSREKSLFPVARDTIFTVQFCRQSRGKSPVSCSVSHTFYSRLSPKMAFLISFSWSKTKRATMALSSAVEGSLMLDADFKRSRTLFRSESIYTVASLESRAL